MNWQETGVFLQFGAFWPWFSPELIEMDAEQSHSLPKGRTIPVLGDKVKELRIKKGWSVAELARRSFRCERTIQSIEMFKEPFESTLIAVAKALGVADIQELMAAPPKEMEAAATPLAPASTPLAGGTFIIIAPPDNFDETTDTFKFIQEIKERYSVKGDIIILDVRKGSIAIDFQLTRDDDAGSIAFYFCDTAYMLEPKCLLIRGGDDLTQSIIAGVLSFTTANGMSDKECAEYFKYWKPGESHEFLYFKKSTTPYGGRPVNYYLMIERTADGWRLEAKETRPSFDEIGQLAREPEADPHAVHEG